MFVTAENMAANCNMTSDNTVLTSISSLKSFYILLYLYPMEWLIMLMYYSELLTVDPTFIVFMSYRCLKGDFSEIEILGVQ